MDHASPSGKSHTIVPVAILAFVFIYGIAACLGWPQAGTRRIVDSQQHAAQREAAPAIAPTATIAPPLWTVIPFVLLLAGIAMLPQIPKTAHWWESNLNRFTVAGGLALLTLAYYAFLHDAALEGHWPAHHVVLPSDAAADFGFVNTILADALLQEFVPFIVLLFSLFTITGGIRIAG